MKILLWVFILFFFFGISIVSADSSCMRCKEGDEMVCIGLPASTVLARCGAPLAINEIGTKTKTHSRGTIYERQESKKDNSVYSTRQNKSSTSMKLEEWTYCIGSEYGNDCYLYILRFKGDSLSKITSTMQKGN
jgi:hypothetical protein